MINEKIHIFKDTAELSEGFTSLLKEELDNKEIVNISLSGGTTPKALFKYWTANYSKTLAWEKIAFFWGDERCVPPEDPMSNYGMTKDLLFDLVEKIDRKKVHRIHGENEPEEEIEWYEDIMDKYLPKENDAPCFDLFMLGLGDDGHTVSIFPNQISLWDNPNNCVEAKHPETWMSRISMTGRVVNNARNIAFLVTGKNKAEKVKQIIKQREEFFNIYPAAKVNPTNGTLHWFLDEEAASLL
ncbi:MAG: 6-phosphogluconolactonase [Dysgonomonas sp.]|nr:6-phosphogluconolactonase [Dysgonomonas sp.]